MRNDAAKVLVTGVVVALFSSCYGAKLVKGPVNSEHASVQADSLMAGQKDLLLRLAQLERLLATENEENARYRALTNSQLREMEESVRVLVSRIEDQSQRNSSRGTYSPRATARGPAAGGTEAGADSALQKSTGGGDDDLYRAAYLDLTRGNYELAIQGFQNYLVRFPAGGHLPEVHYYLGECYYANDRFLEAVSSFQYVIREFSDSRLVPAAYLKAGRCYRQLEEIGLAEKTFRALVAKHPDTEEAAQARAALAELRG